MKKFRKCLALFAMTARLLAATPMTALAFTDEAAQAETPPAETPPEMEPPVVAEENVPETEATPFSVPGNGQLVDDKTEDSTKQFLTIQTKNGNTFFLVLDRSSNTENVYMLSMVDENDLAEFVDEMPKDKEEPETPQVVIPEPEVTPVETEPETEVKTEPEKQGMETGILLAAALLLAGGIGIFYYLKVVKPKKAEEDADDEDLEFYDGGPYVNEEQEGTPGSGEEE